MSTVACSLELASIENDPALFHLFNVRDKSKTPGSSNEPKIEGDEEGDLPGIAMIFYCDIIPIKWYSLNPVKFEPSGSETIKYTPGVGYDYLCYSYHKTHIPPVWVLPAHADEYQIAWCYDSAYQITTSSNFVVDDIVIDQLDPHGIIAYYETNLEPGEEFAHERDTGNSQKLINWDVVHPGMTVQAPYPFFYSRRSETAFPLFRLTSLAKIGHTFNVNLAISRLLRMRRRINDTWVNIPDVNFSVLGGVNPLTHIAVPELWGCFGKIAAEEVEFNECDRPVETAYIENIVALDGLNTHNYRQSDSRDLSHPGLVKAMWWMAHNETAGAYNNHGNYSSDIHDLMAGGIPIVRNTLRYGSSNYKFKEMDSSHFIGPLVRHHFPRCPRRPGVMAYPFCYRVNAIGIDVGARFDKLAAMLAVDLADPNNMSTTASLPGNDGAGQSHVEQPSFKLTCRLLVMRELQIYWRKTPPLAITI